MDLKRKAMQMKKDIPAVCLALKRKDTPVMAKLLAGITVGYALSPVDLIPDFIPVLGYLDDIIILPLLIALTIKFIPKKILMECRAESEGMWENGRPKQWYYAIPIIVIWLLIVLVIVKIIW